MACLTTPMRRIRIIPLTTTVPSRSFVIEPLQHALFSIHECSGFQWWSTFVLAAVGVRAVMLPIVFKQIQAGICLKKSMPEISYLITLLKRKNKSSKTSEQANNMSTFISGAFASLRLHDVKLSHLVGAPFVQIPTFACVIMSIRGLVDEGGLGLDCGGFGPFLDLTVADASLCLPLVAVTSTYINIELSLGKNYLKQHSSDSKTTSNEKEPHINNLHPSASLEEEDEDLRNIQRSTGGSQKGMGEGEQTPEFMVLFKDVMQTGMIISLPLVATLPTGAFVFWLTSSVLTSMQITATRNVKFRKLIGLK